MKFAVSIVLLAYSTHAAPAQEATDSSILPTPTTNRYNKYPPPAVSIPPISSASEYAPSHPTASTNRWKAPIPQSPLLSDYGSDLEDSIDSASTLFAHWSADDCPLAPPVANCYRSRSDFPHISKWLSWNCLISQNLYALLTENGPDEVFMIIASIKAVSDAAGIDP